MNPKHTHTHTHTQLCVFCFFFFGESTSNKPNRQAVGTHTSQAQCGRRLWQRFQPAHQTSRFEAQTSVLRSPKVPDRGSTTDPSSALGSWAQTVFEKHVPNWTHFLSSDWIIIIIHSFIHSLTHSHDAAVTANVLGAATNCTNWGEVATQSPFKCQKVLLLLCVCVCVCVFRSFFL